MSNEKKVGRRDTIKLATAVTALGAGLGVVLDAGEAEAGEPAKLRADGIGNLTVKLFKHEDGGKGASLLETVDLSSFAIKMGKGGAGAYSIKWFQDARKGDGSVNVLSEQAIHVEAPVKR